MDNWLMLVVGLAACVLIEVVAYRAYKRYRARKEALFTKESLGEVFQDMESTRAYLLRSKAFLKQCARRAGEEGDEAVACIVDGLLAGERAQLESLEALRQKLDVRRPSSSRRRKTRSPRLADALESYAAEAAAWAYDAVPAHGPAGAQGRLPRRGEAAAHHRRGGGQAMPTWRAGRRGARSTASAKLSLCPTCGARLLRPQAGLLRRLQPTQLRNGADEARRARLRGYNALIRARTGCGTHARRESEARSSRVVRGSVHP